MGCVASKLEEEEEVVSICRERKRQLKLAVEKRYTLAEAHCRYCHALYAVAAAIELFVARHSSPPSPFLITFPPPCPPSPPTENVINNPMFLQQRPSESTTHEAIACESCGSSTSSDSSEEEREEEEQEEKEAAAERGRLEQPCGYFYMQMPPPMSSPQRDFGWDFFNPFDTVRPEVIGGYQRSSDDDLRVVREEEGIPELEEEGDHREEQETKVVVAEENVGEKHDSGVEVVKVVDSANVSQKEHKGLTVIDTPVVGRELLDALKDIEDHFIRAYNSGKDVSRMLEANRVHLQNNLEEIKENSTKLIQSISWNRSISSKPSSCKSLVASTSKSSSTWTEFNNDLFEEYGGMASGSHSLTLGRLYAWEKKLYEEVKAGDSMRKIYEKKCSRLRNQDVRGDDELSLDKTRAAVKDLYARILVAIRSADLTRTWKIMLESHETQNKILFEVRSFTCPTFGKFCNDTHRLATLQLEAELQNWHACFMDYVAAQKGYVEALHGWLSKFIAPEVEVYSRGSRSRNSAVPFRVNGPPLLVICHDWLASMDKLPDKAVAFALKSFAKDVRALWHQQGKEQQQKRKVDSLAKDLDRRILSFQKVESWFLESKLTEQKSESEVEHPDDYLTDKKDHLDTLRSKLDTEKEKHHNYMQETQRITLNGFQTVEFSKVSQNIYNDLVNCKENAEKAGTYHT
ncbi:nitrate regulatory gene2 protein [Quercus suber]|uniref:Nitrate regulatory gene2 protein n=1 Tax=Quercus suber TaxID=58331 RepID=A0AAW0JBI2_QUESU